MNTFLIIVLTLTIYSMIATIAIELTHENDEVIAAFGFGIFGCILILIRGWIRRVKQFFQYHHHKRSIFEERSTGKRYVCKTKDTEDVRWNEGYQLIRRYVPKSEWIGIPEFDQAFIARCKRNCNHCKHDKSCQYNYPKNIKCKHDEFGKVLEFDRFEERKGSIS